MTGTSRVDLLGIYLNDHLAGATAGTQLFRRAAGSHEGPTRATLERLGQESDQDRATLLDLMGRLGVPVRQYKVLAGWLGEKAGRFKPNGGLVRRSPLSSLVETEALMLGVCGKSAAWRTLRELADTDDRLDAGLLDGLLEKADAQHDELEELRAQFARDALG
jgi:hypothetical protein